MTQSLTAQDKQAIIAQGHAALWRIGNLTWKLDEGRPTGPQRDIYVASKRCGSSTFVTEAARRLGKTYVHALIAAELAIRNPGRRINWCQDTAKGIRDHAVPLFTKVCADAPPDCRGEFKEQRGAFVFPNGAYIYIFGGDSQEDADRSRGGDDPIANFLDEAGFISLLEYILNSIIKPAMLRTQRRGHFGMTFLVSSTPDTPSHYFCTVADRNALRGSYRKKTIYESPHANRFIAEEASDAGLTVEQLVATDTFRREFLCERIVNADTVVFKEYADHRLNIVREHPRPLGFDRYIFKRVAVDLGTVDKTGILFGYVDFLQAKIVVEAESLIDAPTTADTAAEIKRVEAELWGDPGPSRISRVVDDAQKRTILDLNELYRVRAESAIKHDRLASIALVRDWIQAERLVIHPRCIQLQSQLLNATWNKTKKDFARTVDGHYDLAAALMYFCRGLDLTWNPYPHDWNSLTGRSLPDHHPAVARRTAMGQGPKDLAGAILGHNPYVAGQLKRR